MADLQRIRIGNQTAASAPSITEPFEYALQNGFDAFEWFPDKKEGGAGWEEREISSEMRSWIRYVAREHDIALSVHAPWQVDPLAPGADQLLVETATFADALGACLVNVHLQAHKGLDAFLKAIGPLIDRTAQCRLRLSIENTPDTTPQQLNEFFSQLRRLSASGTGHVGMCLDVGHANLCPETRNDYLRFVDLLDPSLPIAHVHLHENYGDHDSHLPLFTGPAAANPAGILGLLERLMRRNFTGCIILEQWPNPPGLLMNAREKLREMLNTAARPSPAHATNAGNAFVGAIVKANRQYQSWRKRLEWIRDLLVRAEGPTEEQLVDLSIYLRFIGTGEVPCAEDDGHYRPSHHAKLSHEIYEALVKITTPANSFIIRKIYPWLPSFNRAFTRSEPLTRIRDIAHRNDIPAELKREIKTSLQNKLHRSAGPEDLVTSEALLRRITAPGTEYSHAFVDEFKRFHEELKEFFNARSLDEDLVAVSHGADDRVASLVRRFLEVKADVRSPAQPIDLLEVLTQLRRQLRLQFEEKTTERAQEARGVDIKLEDFAFALLSNLINQLSHNPGFSKLPAVRILSLAVANISLNGIEPAECGAIESELQMQTGAPEPAHRDWLLLLYATVERSSRLAEAYSGEILKLFPEKVDALGRALGVEERARKIFAEADIRFSLVFQLSRLVTVLGEKIRTAAGLPRWEVIVPGKGRGQLIALKNLADLPTDTTTPLLVLADNVEGDENILQSVNGLIVRRAVPHLSHLAIRARQRGVAFVVCEDAGDRERLKRNAGRSYVLQASPDKVSVEESTLSPAVNEVWVDRRIPQKGVHVPEVPLSSAREVLPMNMVKRENGGAKALGARMLAELSASAVSGFLTPPGVVIPYAVMDQSLRSAKGIEKEYRALVARLDDLSRVEAVVALDRVMELILQLPIPTDISAAVEREFGRTTHLIVRSSSNIEDLEDFAGAGLYESVANVAPANVAQAIRRVWSSLWTLRAAMSRKERGIPHARAHMAVLIQQMIEPDISFVMHTVNPVSHNHDEVCMELAVGLGEALGSGGIFGSPYRMVYKKQLRSVEMRYHASFSQAVVADPAGGVTRRVVDYSRVRFSTDQLYRNEIGLRLGKIGTQVESAMSHPQDIEGAVVGDSIYLFQSRKQQVAT